MGLFNPRKLDLSVLRGGGVCKVPELRKWSVVMGAPAWIHRYTSCHHDCTDHSAGIGTPCCWQRPPNTLTLSGLGTPEPTKLPSPLFERRAETNEAGCAKLVSVLQMTWNCMIRFKVQNDIRRARNSTPGCKSYGPCESYLAPAPALRVAAPPQKKPWHLRSALVWVPGM